MLNRDEKSKIEVQISKILNKMELKKKLKIEVYCAKPRAEVHVNIFIDYPEPENNRKNKRSNKITLRFSDLVEKDQILNLVESDIFIKNLIEIYPKFEFENQKTDGRDQILYIISSEGKIEKAVGEHDLY